MPDGKLKEVVVPTWRYHKKVPLGKIFKTLKEVEAAEEEGWRRKPYPKPVVKEGALKPAAGVTVSGSGDREAELNDREQGLDIIEGKQKDQATALDEILEELNEKNAVLVQKAADLDDRATLLDDRELALIEREEAVKAREDATVEVKPSDYAVMKEGNGKALRVFDTEQQAQDYINGLANKTGISYEARPR